MRAIAIVILLPLAGCAALMNDNGPRPEDVLERGLTAYDQNDFRSAYEDLSWIYSNFWERQVGERALLALAAVELDPRNPGRRLLDGADLASWYSGLPRATTWSVPVSRTIEGLARELNFTYEEIAELDAEKERLEGELEAARREAAREARAAAAARADAVEARQQTRRALAQARAAASAPAPAPASPPPAAAGISALQAERDRLADEVQQLRRSIAAREREMERMQETILRP